MTKDLALFLLRLSGFGLAVGHGWQKIAMLSSGGGDRFVAGVEALGFPMPLAFAWAAGLAELVGGLAIALGIGTRIAAGFAAFTMFVATMFRHHLPQHILIWLLRAHRKMLSTAGATRSVRRVTCSSLSHSCSWEAAASRSIVS